MPISGIKAMKLWYRKHATEYMNGLPIGTGRLAAMILGVPGEERVALNHEWLRRGLGRDREPQKSAHLLCEVRELLLAGKYEEGTVRGNAAFGGPGGVHQETLPNRIDPYQPAGDFRFTIEHGEATDYRRELDIDKAVVTVCYQSGGKYFKREYLAHIEHDLVLVRLSADAPFTSKFWLDRVTDETCLLHFDTSAEYLIIDGQFKGGIDFRTEARIVYHDGTASVQKESISIKRATEVIITLNVGTSAKSQSPAKECEAYTLPHTDWSKLVESHEAAYRRFFGNLTLEIDLPEKDMPTDERIQAMRDGVVGPGLPLLYFNYGRYLLVACTATGELPPNLQGKWNEDVKPPWECDYHHDINLQMNFWPAENGHLQYATETLFQHVERLVPHARKAASDIYGCRGVWFPINSDAWGRSTPEAYGWAVWIGAAPWLAQHMWWHYAYGQDLQFLKVRAYPFFKEVAAFYESYLIEDDKGCLQVVPSQSPENRFVGSSSLPVSLCVSATMDVQLARDTLNYALRSARVLNLDEEKQKLWLSMLNRLPETKIGKSGQLQEWNEDFEEVEPAHRHMSHLIGLFPGDSIDPERTPGLWQAAQVSLERRLSSGGGHTGWSRAWVACLYARLCKASESWEHLCHLISDFATDSLLDLHPPRIFQIDGNFGGTAAVLEMLLQSYHEELHFLPALPTAWSKGSVKGFRARGGYTVDMTWDDNRLIKAKVSSITARSCTILHAAGKYIVKDDAGNEVECKTSDHRIRFEIEPGRPYMIITNT